MSIHYFCPLSISSKDIIFKATSERFFHQFLESAQFSPCQFIYAYNRLWTSCGSHANDGNSLSKVKWFAIPQLKDVTVYTTFRGIETGHGSPAGKVWFGLLLGHRCTLLKFYVQMKRWLPDVDLQYCMHWQCINCFVGGIFAVLTTTDAVREVTDTSFPLVGNLSQNMGWLYAKLECIFNG